MGGMTSSAGDRLRHDLADLVQIVRSESADPDAVLGELTESAAASVPGAGYAGITTVSGDGKVETAASSGPYPGLLDEIQARHGQGPCLSAAWEQHMIRIPDLTREQRWPDYCRDALAETPIRSVIAFQLFTGRQGMGALNFYAEQPQVFDAHAVELAVMAATHTALGWELLRRDEQFRSALASRDIIGQAKGMIMERFTINAVQAFELLKRLSQESNTPLAAIARQLVEGEHR